MPDNLPAWNPETMPYPTPVEPPQYGQQAGYANPYDTRIGAGALPPGITGAAERAYVGQTQPDQTANYQIGNLLNSKGAYMQNAERRGLDIAQRRGLLNSSIAAGNAQRSAIEAAAPIAMQDAQTYAQQARQNVDVLNQRAIANMARQGGGGGGGQAIARLQLEGQLQAQRERLAYEGEQAELGRQHGNYLQTSGYGQALGLQNNQYGNMLNNQLRSGAFDAAVNSNFSSQNFFQQASIAAMNNPAIISNPQNFQNYLSYMQGPFQQSIGSFLDFALQGFN